MKFIRIGICANFKMYWSKLQNVFVWIEVKRFPRACYEIDTLAFSRWTAILQNIGMKYIISI